ncbi:MAG: amino acid racemase [Hyphomonadaceae bacterium]
MKLLGVLGGMSWESTAHYYRLINRMVRERVGGQSSARLALWSVDFGPMAKRIGADDWEPIRTELMDASKRLADAGAGALVIATNTMHRFADDIEAASGLRLIHIADVTAKALARLKVRRPLVLATRPTMETDFYLDRLRAHGLDPVIPEPGERLALNAIIFDELVQGVFTDASRDYVLDAAKTAWARDSIDSVILGCTEFGLLTPPELFRTPAVDTTEAHCEAAVDWLLSPDP